MRRFVLVALLVPAMGCGEEPVADYYPPLEKGKTRHYTITAQAQSESERILHASLVRRGDGKETIGGHVYWKEVDILTGLAGAEPDVNYYRYADEGVYQLDGDHLQAGEFLIVPFPLRVGQRWTVNEPSGTTVTYTAAAIESYPLASRTFERCLKLTMSGAREDGEKFEGTIYRAPGEGELRVILEISGGTIDFVLQTPLQ